MEPDRKKLSEDIQRQIEKLYLLIDCVEMLPGQQGCRDYGRSGRISELGAMDTYGSGGKVKASPADIAFSKCVRERANYQCERCGTAA